VSLEQNYFIDLFIATH
jgi:hypothetical protein